ncbi:MAG: hypothetical protein R3D58_13165 [Saprospiraceae bacterium]
MTRLFKQRWFIVLVAAAVTAGIIIYVWPRLKQMKSGQATTTTPQPPATAEEPKQTLTTRLVGNVTVSGN